MLLSSSGLQAGNSFLLASLDSLVSVSRKGVVAGVIGTCTALFLVWIVVVLSLLLCFRIRVIGNVYGSQLKAPKVQHNLTFNSCTYVHNSFQQIWYVFVWFNS